MSASLQLQAALRIAAGASAPTFVRKVDGFEGTTGSTFTLSSVASSGTGRLLIVWIAAYGGGDTSPTVSVKFNTTETFTRLGIANWFDGSGGLECWYLLNPSATTANVVIVTTGLNSEFAACCEVYNGSTTAPTDFTSDIVLDPSTTSSASVSVASSTSDLIVAGIAASNSGARTYTPGSGQTRTSTSDNNTGLTALYTSRKAGAASSTTMSEAISPAYSETYAGIAIHP